MSSNRPAGELDLAGVEASTMGKAPYVGSAPFLDTEPEQITFELEIRTFTDSPGFAPLLQISNDVDRVSLNRVTPTVRRVPEITGRMAHFGESS